MSKLCVTVQPAPFVDFVTEDGHECYKTPYPYSIDAEGFVQFQDFWQGYVYRAIGFSRDLNVPSIEVFWADAFANPELGIGLYLVTSDDEGNWGTHRTPIESYWKNELHV